MEEIENEIEKKSIERAQNEQPNITKIKEEDISTTDTPAVVKKSKKIRSPAQIAAFEKARAVRIERAAIKKKLLEEERQAKREKKKIMKEKVSKILEEEEEVDIQKVDIPKVDIPKVDNKPKVDKPKVDNKPIKREYSDRVVNNYYYYGITPDVSSIPTGPVHTRNKPEPEPEPEPAEPEPKPEPKQPKKPKRYFKYNYV